MAKQKQSNKALKPIVSVLVIWAFVLSAIAVASAAESIDLGITGLAAEYTTTDSTNATCTNNEGTLTLNAKTKSTSSGCETTYTETSVTLTMSNSSYEEAVLTFSYTVPSAGSLTINNTIVSNNGTYTGTLAKNGSVSIVLTSISKEKEDDTTNVSAVISAISLTETKNIDVAFEPVSGVAYSVNGTDVGELKTFEVEVGTPFTIAVSTDHYYLVGLTCNVYGSDGTIVSSSLLSYNASYTCYPTEDCTIVPVFVCDDNDVAPFKVGTALYWTWETAVKAAYDVRGTVILNDNYTLPSDLSGNGLTASGTYVKYDEAEGSIEYLIPNGVTFLVPYDSAHTGLVDSEYPQTLNGIINDTEYRLENAISAGVVSAAAPYSNGTLTVGANTTIQSNGSLIVNGQQWATPQRDTGSACGPYGLIKLTDTTSAIYVESGTLFCYGYIIGEGLVTVDDGATLYELLQLTDWRGFTAALSWLGVDMDVSSLGITELYNLAKVLVDAKSMQQDRESFVFSQYYVQNIEADLQINVGASQNVAIAMNTKEEDIPQYIVPFIGTDEGFIKLSGEGSALRQYDASTDRTTYTVDCDATTGSIELTFGTTLLGISLSATIDTQYNIFALNSNLSIIVCDGGSFTLSYGMKLLPEASVDVEPGGELILAEGVEFYLYDKADWLAGSYAYNADYYRVNYVASNHSSGGKPFARVIDESSKLNIDGTLTINSGANLFTTAGYTRNGASTVADAGNTDKLVTGTGVIVNNGTTPDDEDSAADFGKLDEFEFSGSFTIAHEIETVPFVAKLSGVTDGTTYKYNSFATGTYYGLGSAYDNYWYQYYVKAVDENGASATANVSNVPALASTGVSASKTVSRYNSTTQAQETISNVAGLVSNYLTSYSATDSDGQTVTMYQSNQSAFSFKVSDGYDVYLNSVADANKLTPTDGTYTLNGIAADATLVLVQQSTGATYYVTITWKQTSTATYTPAQTTYTWSPTELKYTANEAKWTGTSVMKITIDNTQSGGAVTANFSYTETIESTMSGDALTVAAGKIDSRELTVTPSGDPDKPETGNEIILGTITITLSKEE